MSRRRFFVLAHRVNGLLLAGFLTAVGSTGACLAWKIQLERIFAPALFRLAPHQADTRRVDPLWARHRVELAYPWARVDVADLSSQPDVPLEFWLTPRQGEKLSGFDEEAFADPYAGRVLGSRRYGDLRQGVQNIVPFIYQLHEELALGRTGTICLGLAALLWTFDCFVAIYLSFPGRQRKRQSFKIRWRGGGYRRLYDLHRAPGVWLWLMLLIFAWTGVAFNLPAVYGPVMHLFGGPATAEERSEACLGGRDSEPDWAVNLARARGLMKTASENRGFRIKAERFLSYERETCRWTYRVRSSLDVDQIGNTQLIWRSGEEAKAIFSAATGQSAAGTFTTWMEAIHEAQTGGLTMRWLVFVSGIVTALLSVTGVLIFIRKMGWGRRIVKS